MRCDVVLAPAVAKPAGEELGIRVSLGEEQQT
jgi:hypothetical protein